MYGPGPVPSNDGYAVASVDLSTEYEVILLTSEGTNVRCKVRRRGSQALKRVGRTASRRALLPGVAHSPSTGDAIDEATGQETSQGIGCW